METNDLKEFLESILIVLVIYEMKILESPTFKSLQQGLNDENNPVSIFIFDNSTQSQQWDFSSKQKFFYHHDASNPGVSKAYNEGYKKAKGLNKKWILLADQDTIFPQDFFFKLKKAVSQQSRSKLFAPIVHSNSKIISPFQFFLGKGWRLNKAEPKAYPLNKVKFINSGLCVAIDLFEKCNGYDERFPLDFSDLVFAERVLKHQDELVVIDCVCRHGLSSEANSLEKMLKRFPYFLRASKLYGEVKSAFFFLRLYSFLRTLKLSIVFRNLEFIVLYFRS